MAEKIIIEVGVEGNASVQVNKLVQGLDDLGKEAKQSAKIFDQFGKQVNKTDSFMDEFTTEADKAAKATDKLEKEAKQATKQSKNLAKETKSGSKSAKEATSAFTVFAGVLGANVLTGAFNQAVAAGKQLFNVFITQGIAAAKVQEDAINSLNTALALSGKFSEEASQDFQNFASELQKTTTVGDEATLQTAALIQSLGGLEQDGLKRATSAAIDLSAALGIDLNAAAVLVGKAASGEVSSFSRYGLIIKKASTNAGTLENALTALESKFGGAAASKIKTFSGATEQAGNAFGDLQEATGGTLTTNKALISVIAEMGKQFAELGEFIQANEKEIQSFVSDGIIFLIKAAKVTIVAVDEMILVFNKFMRTLKLAKLGFQATVDTITLGAVDMSKEMEQTVKEIQDLDKNIKSLEDGSDIGNAINDALQEMQQKAESAADSGNEMVEAFKKISDAKRELDSVSIAVDAFGEKGKALAAQLNTENEKRAETVASQTALLESALEQQLISEVQFGVAVAQLRLTEDAAKLAQQEKDAKALLDADIARTAALDKEVQDLLAQNDLLAQIGDEASLMEIEKNTTRLSLLEENEEVSLGVRIGLKRKAIAQENAMEKQRLQAASGSLSQLASLRGSHDKKMAAVGKAAAITQTTIDTIKGAQGAASALAPIPIIGPFLAIAAAAAFTIAGFARVRQIAGTPLQAGITEVPGVGTKDNFPAVLAPKERVVDANTNQDLKGFLAGDSQMVGLLASINNRIGSLESRVIVNVGNKQIANVLRDQIQSGRRVV